MLENEVFILEGMKYTYSINVIWRFIMNKKITAVLVLLFCVSFFGKVFADSEGVQMIPMGDVDRRLVETIANITDKVMGIPVDVGRGVSMPSVSYDFNSEKVSGNMAMNALEGYDEGRRVFKVTYERMFAILNKPLMGPEPVFGNINRSQKRLIMSLTPLREQYYGRKPNKQLFKQRAFKMAVHELGESYGLKECDHKRCIMGPVKSIEDLDEMILELCPKCKREFKKLRK